MVRTGSRFLAVDSMVEEGVRVIRRLSDHLAGTFKSFVPHLRRALRELERQMAILMRRVAAALLEDGFHLRAAEGFRTGLQRVLPPAVVVLRGDRARQFRVA